MQPTARPTLRAIRAMASRAAIGHDVAHSSSLGDKQDLSRGGEH